MTKEDIEKAAVDSCVFENSIFNPELTPYYEQGFKDGANWRINSIWHSARKDVPEAYFQVLVEDDLEDFEVCMLAQEECPQNWVRWAYVKDLIPNKED